MADGPPPDPSHEPMPGNEPADRESIETTPPPLALGQRVRLNRAMPYLKSAEPMPMLRPPDLVDVGETGQVVGLRSGQQVAVRFRRGTFLLEQEELMPVRDPG